MADDPVLAKYYASMKQDEDGTPANGQLARGSVKICYPAEHRHSPFASGARGFRYKLRHLCRNLMSALRGEF